jgi:hypothetical protein
MRQRRWWLLSVAAVVIAAGAGLPWALNPVLGDRSGLVVLFGEDASVPVTLTLLGAVVMMLTGVAAAGVDGGRSSPWVAVVGGLVALGCLGRYGVRITAEWVRSYGVDGAGNVVEPEAVSRLGVGWYLTGAALLMLVAAVAVAMRHPRRRRRSP